MSMEILVEFVRNNNELTENVQYYNTDMKARYYGIGKYRKVPRNKKRGGLANNAVRCGLVRKLKDNYKPKKEKVQIPTANGSIEDFRKKFGIGQ